MDTYGQIISALAFDMSNQLAMPPSVNGTDGIGEIRIVGRDVNGSLDPEAVLKATEDFEADFTAGNALALTTGVVGGTAGCSRSCADCGGPRIGRWELGSAAVRSL